MPRAAPGPTAAAPSVATDLAAVYVRVSSSGQMGRDGDDDGYSIPAQVQGCERKATELGTHPARVYIERAESARSDARPVLQQMLAELPALGVKYLIVHKIDRFARNRLDDALLYERLMAMGITLVSATENVDATPSGRLMHGMLATFAEYYSNNLATEVLKGLTQKAKQGGTPNRAPIGYLNVRRMVEGQEVRTVAVDPERAPFVRLAFDLYATGQWSIGALTQRLNDLGMRTRPTPKHPPKEVATSLIQAMLHNRYYIREVRWNDQVYEGRHEQLIDTETFEKVGALLTAHNQSGEHRMKQHHYLKGTLRCAHCGERMIFGLSRGRNGTQYPYFFCISRAKRTGCVNRANIRAELLEEAVEHEYAAIERSVRSQDVQATKAAIQSHFAKLRGEAESAQSTQKRRIEALKGQRRELLHLRYQEAIALDLFREEQERLNREIEVAERILAATLSEFTHAEEILTEAMDLSCDVQDAYMRAINDPDVRRMMNQLFLVAVEVEVDGTVHAELAAPFADIRSGHIAERVKKAVDALVAYLNAANPSHLFDGQGSNLTKMVGAAGFEPATSRV